MSNMSYCRFQNTRGDLRDCKVALAEFLHGHSEDWLGEDELDAACSLLRLCRDMVLLIADGADVDVGDLDTAGFEKIIDGAMADAQAAYAAADSEDETEDQQ